MMEAISASPATIAEILRLANEIREGRVVISTVVDGFSNPNEADDYVAEEDFDEFDADDDDDGNGGSKALTKKLEELKTPGAGALRPHPVAVREGPQDLRQGRLRHARLREGPARLVRRADDHPLHGQDDRKAVRHGARPGRRRAQEGARTAPHHRRQVRHAAGDLHPRLPAQPAEPEVGREAGRRRQALVHHHRAQHPADPGTAAKARRPAVARGGAAGAAEGHQQAHERTARLRRAKPRRK